jgi:YjbE family integral membrane protein
MTGIVWADIVALLQIAFIDLVLAGDNAIVVGLAVAGLPRELRRKAILLGLAGAVILRILFSIVALSLLQILGLTLAGGVLLVWVAWKLFRELRGGSGEEDAHAGKARTTLRGAVGAILLADVSMSLDNALAVAGAAHDHIKIMVAGLVLSVALMAIAADWVARLIVNHRWLGYVGLAVVAYVAIDMVIRGTSEVIQAL